MSRIQGSDSDESDSDESDPAESDSGVGSDPGVGFS